MAELDAVNQMLSSIGEQKVNSLESSGLTEVDIARDTLHETSRDVQAQGWHFNTDYAVRLLPDHTGVVHLPRNCLAAYDPTWRLDVMQRGGRLYDRKSRGFIFKNPVVVSLVTFLEFHELNHPARRFIAIKACRRFQERVQQSQITEEFLLREEQDAKNELLSADADAARYNIVHDNLPSARTAAWDLGL